ncbi:MAG: 1,4-dihydroxy-2-naphthoate polyprenyltransferase [Chitinophagales bacterium]|mgnify:CR=1 FL=1|nr:1,4-dihydroxy-2-naphthoate polyprenyltransferase [Chitinophagales bacterium]
MASVSAWLTAFRLNTLPLSISTIIMGSFLAAYQHQFNGVVTTVAMITTLFLQILSNLANDYGDAESGVDNHDRLGPKRGLQAGTISKKNMKKAIVIFILLSLISGIYLVIEGTKGVQLSYSLLLFLVGVGAIIAALKYTMGKNPYGYSGFGDLFVFIFFGLVGVLGTYFLHTHQLPVKEFLPAISMGCFSTGVLNLNNLRDRVNDAAFNKRTIVVKLGLQNAKYYHAILLSIGMLSAIIFTVLTPASAWKWLYLIAFIGIIRSIVIVMKNVEPKTLEPELKKLALSTLLFSILFGVGLLL